MQDDGKVHRGESVFELRPNRLCSFVTFRSLLLRAQRKDQAQTLTILQSALFRASHSLFSVVALDPSHREDLSFLNNGIIKAVFHTTGIAPVDNDSSSNKENGKITSPARDLTKYAG